MRRNKRIFLIAFITIITVFSSINFANINVIYANNKLNKPENLKWSETKPGVLTFSKVQYADEYWAVILKDGEKIAMGGDPLNEVSIQGLMEQYGTGTYTVELSANRLDGSFQSSEKVTTIYTAKQLSKPENLKWSETKPGVLTFSKVQYADEYWAVISKDGQEIGMGGDEKNEVSIQGLMEQYGAGTYTVQLSARRLDNLLPASEKVTTTYTAKQLSKPENLKWSETKPGVLTFSKVQYADEYWAVISKDGQKIGMGGDASNEVSIQGLIEQYGTGTYTVELSAQRLDGILPSSEKVTTTYTVKDTNTNDKEDNKEQTTKPNTSTSTKPSTATKPSTTKPITTKPTDTKTETSNKDENGKETIKDETPKTEDTNNEILEEIKKEENLTVNTQLPEQENTNSKISISTTVYIIIGIVFTAIIGLGIGFVATRKRMK